MAELMVQVEYGSKMRTGALALLRLTFPLWGVVAPICSIIALCVCVGNMHSSSWETDYLLKGIGAVLAGLLTPAAALLATRALSMDCIVADRNGLQLPFSFSTMKRYLPWAQIGAAKVTPPNETDMAKRSLTLITTKGKSYRLSLSRFKPQQAEQILLALEMWAPRCERDSTVLGLQQQLKSNTLIGTDMSYTNMWEDELRRRFCATAFMPLEPGFGLRNGSLKVIRHLALGGLSALYLCQLQDKKLVVVKEAVVPEDSPESVRNKAKEMFEREATFLMKLDHPSIVKVLDCFTDSGRNYMMLEYVNGQDIRQYVRQNGPQREHVVLEWAVQIANILKHLHEQDPPIIHRDLTPDNLVLRDDGSIILIDFGAANELIGNATGTFVGKQSFIAPEQFRGRAVVQSDIYAFGCTLHYLLTGEEPEALATSEPRDVNEELSEDINELVSCCTQLEPRDRFQSAAQMLPILRKMSASLSVS